MAKYYDKQNMEVIRSVMRRLNRAPKDILAASAKEALYTAVTSTEQDSGNAAWHWTIVGFRASDKPDVRRIPFSIAYGQSPIGERGDKGDTSDQVIDAVLRDGYEVIDDMVLRKGRVAVTIYNDIVNSSLGHNQYLERAGIDRSMMTEVARAALERARLAASKRRFSATTEVPK